MNLWLRSWCLATTYVVRSFRADKDALFLQFTWTTQGNFSNLAEIILFFVAKSSIYIYNCYGLHLQVYTPALKAQTPSLIDARRSI